MRSYGTIALCTGSLALAVMALADGGQFRHSPHGSATSGVYRDITAPRGSCAQCHLTHDESPMYDYGLFTFNANELCFGAGSGGCHADRPTGGTSGYPAGEADRLPIGSSDPGYFEANTGGVRTPGVENLVRWPGRQIWENPAASPHYFDSDMPVKDIYGNGSCDNCHDVHGSANPHDMLDSTYAGVTGSDLGMLPDQYRLCLSCHSLEGPSGMDDTSRSIAYFYDRTINPGDFSGHGITSAGGYLNSGYRLPCYDCHNPHGSAGYGGTGANRYLLSDQRYGWYGLTDIKTDNEQVRRFCFGCHPAADHTLPVEPVEGLSLQPLPATVADHLSAGSGHCYDCHGRDYSSPTGNNVHNPSPGGDCVSCHSRSQVGRRAVSGEFDKKAHHVIAIGGTGLVTNADCGVCHMEGVAQTGSVDNDYHANGAIDLRDPDNGMALPPFSEFSRDRNSAVLEPWVTDVQAMFCLRCHDANGAVSPLARVPGGTAQAPFSDPAALVIDVNSQFDPSNTSYHPVRAAGTNPYTVPNQINDFNITMRPPFNQTALHDQISCFDCHTSSGHGSDTTGMLLVETDFRNPFKSSTYFSGTREFCTRCHDANVYVFDFSKGTRFEAHHEGAHNNPGGGNVNSQSCRGCHAGVYDDDQDASCDNGSGIGAIHGSAYGSSACSPTPGVQPKAFIFGGYVSGWDSTSTLVATCYANCHHPQGESY